MATQSTFNKLRIRRTEAMITIIGVPDVPGNGATVFRAFSKAGVPITMIVQNAPDAGSANLTFTVHSQDEETALDITRRMVEELGAVGLMHDEHIARLSVLGANVLEDAVGVAGEFFSILAAEGINIIAINSTADALSCIIEDANLDRAADLISKKFGLEVETIQ